ncbi:YceI family protein [Lysobacter koreensis]|uniref:YceI family protein n=1 Tax=Lysobacter koreensis TaxID=266122 RepID=A0ABW2YMB0_9GAMM
MPSARAAVLTLAALLVAAVPMRVIAADPAGYALDPVHTRVLFAVSHAGFSQALGTVSGSTGTLWFDRDDWRSARLDVRVPLARLDLGDPKWNAAALASNLLDGDRHPEARFVSRTVEPVDADQALVCGELTLRAVTRPLCLDVTFNQLKRHPLPPFRRTVGFSASATLSRADYGIDAWKSVIGDEVELRIEAEAVRSNRADETLDASDEVAAPIAEPAAPPEPVQDPPTDPSPEPVP